MKFFDYKFLILLGLTLVVYFIYREVEYLREKVDKLERTLNSNVKPDNKLESVISTKSILEEKKFPVLALPKMEQSSVNYNCSVNETTPKNLFKNNEAQPIVLNNIIPTKNPSPKVSPKMISVDLMSTTLSGTNITSNFNKNPGIQFVQKKINDILEQSDSESESEDTTTSVSESSKHLAIYSNDNEQFDETQNSLLESVEATKNDLKFDYNRMEIPNLKGTMESIMNNLSSDAYSENKKSPIDEIIEEKEKQLSEMSNSIKNKHSFDSDEIKIPICKNTESEKDDKEEYTSDKLNEQTLNNMKLPEIKKIAEQHKITITKKVNGQQKPKNKNELITEILNK